MSELKAGEDPKKDIQDEITHNETNTVESDQYDLSHLSGKDPDSMNFMEMVMLEEDLKAARADAGIEEKDRGIFKLIGAYFDRQARFEGVLIKKKTYLLLAVFTGIVGGHRFYTKQYGSACIYLATCWCGFSIAMTIIDLMAMLPKKTDSEGRCYLIGNGDPNCPE